MCMILVINMKKILFTFLLLIAPTFEAWGIVDGGTNSGQQTIVDTCANVKNWTEGAPQNGDTWYFNNDAECKLYRRSVTCNTTTQRPNLYEFSCGAGCYWQVNSSFNNNTIGTKKPGSCKKCPSGKWSSQYMQKDKNSCYEIDQVYYPFSDEHKYCRATACKKGTNAELINDVYVCTSGGVFDNKNLCVCEDKYYKQGTECKKCPDGNTTVSKFSKVYYQKEGRIKEEPLNTTDNGIHSCALYGTSDAYTGEPVTFTDETGTFKISDGGFCYY